jgi:hypothetical protein
VVLISELPDWTQLSMFALSVVVNGFFVIKWVNGGFVSRKEVDQVQKMADTWQHGWETSQNNFAVLTGLVNELTPIADTLKKFISSLPQPGGENDAS